jgi:hypothetical protein
MSVRMKKHRIKKYRNYELRKRNELGEYDIFKSGYYQATGKNLRTAIAIVDAIEGD